MNDVITGRPSYRPFVACGSYEHKRAAESAARELSSETQAWEAVPVHKLRRAERTRPYAIRRLS